MTIKFCGIRTVEEACVAIETGADMIGLVFVPGSTRRIGLEEAEAVEAIARGKVKVVCVFQNQSASEVEEVIHRIQPDMLQFHGRESMAFLSLFDLPIVRAVGVGESDDVSTICRAVASYDGYTILIDREERGRGLLPTVEVLREVSNEFPFILSGGLHAHNVGPYLSGELRLLGVDVSSGIRSGETLDMEKCKLFVKTCRNSLSLKEAHSYFTDAYDASLRSSTL
jgi:phosphoribosylanthranilate isomerase